MIVAGIAVDLDEKTSGFGGLQDAHLIEEVATILPMVVEDLGGTGLILLMEAQKGSICVVLGDVLVLLSSMEKLENLKNSYLVM